MDMLKTWGWLVLLLVAAIGAVALVFWRNRKQPVMATKSAPRSFNADDWKPRTMRPLTKTELRVMAHLQAALPDCLLMPQISLSRFLQVGHNRSYQHWFSAVGRRSVDYLVCSKQGDVLGAVMLSSITKNDSTGMRRKRQTLELARIPVWEMKPSDLPSTEEIRALVTAEIQAAEQHSQMASQLHADNEWKPTELQPRHKTGVGQMQGVESVEMDDGRWNQAWPSEEASASAFLDSDAMGLPDLPDLPDLSREDGLAVPPIKHKGSARHSGMVR